MYGFKKLCGLNGYFKLNTTELQQIPWNKKGTCISKANWFSLHWTSGLLFLLWFSATRCLFFLGAAGTTYPKTTKTVFTALKHFLSINNRQTTVVVKRSLGFLCPELFIWPTGILLITTMPKKYFPAASSFEEQTQAVNVRLNMCKLRESAHSENIER